MQHRVVKTETRGILHEILLALCRQPFLMFDVVRAMLLRSCKVSVDSHEFYASKFGTTAENMKKSCFDRAATRA